uniref:Purine nucleoside phosphorylase n=1 Tax=Steinernema glaseri TaxID=37863 RepID=A0A1I8ASU4_9BILA
MFSFVGRTAIKEDRVQLRMVIRNPRGALLQDQGVEFYDCKLTLISLNACLQNQSTASTLTMNGHATAAMENGYTNGDHFEVDPRNYDHVVRVADTIASLINMEQKPTIGIICGSGLGELADRVTETQVVPYSKIPGFPGTSVVGHKGNLVFGKIGDKSVICMQGRFHPYEHGMNLALCAMPVRIMHLLGVKTLIVSNAAGGINENFQYGDLMLLKDHIFLPALAGFSPLVGVNDPRFGQRFVSVHDAYDIKLRKMALKIAEKQNIRVHEGIYVMSGGPQYESPAEVKLFKTVGADALGMSTCHEVTVARQCGIQVLGFSLITNIANLDADNSVEVSHEEVLETAKEASQRACNFVNEIIESI